MSDLIAHYKEVRKRLNGGAPPPPVIKLKVVENPIPPRPEPKMKELPPEKDPASKEYAYRERLRKSILVTEGISYREALLRGAENLPRRIKLAVLPILEESNFSWEELFKKDPLTNRNNRTREAVSVKWKIFKVLNEELGLTVNLIARICDMDHTTVFYGLGKLRTKRNKRLEAIDK